MAFDNNRIKGAGTELVTPFSEDGAVDAGALSRLVNASCEGGMDFLCVLGPVSEAASLSAEEKKLVRETVAEAAAGRLPLLLGLDAGISPAKFTMMPESSWDGFDAFLVSAAPDEKDVFGYFSDIARFSPLPVFICSDGDGIPSDTVLRLAEKCHRIAGAVIVSGEGEDIRDILEKRPDGFAVLSGDDSFTCELLLNGADGAVSAAANAMPETEWLLVHSLTPEVAMSADMLLRPYVELIAKEGCVTGIKYMLSKMGIAENVLREPLRPASEGLCFDFNLLMK